MPSEGARVRRRRHRHRAGEPPAAELPRAGSVIETATDEHGRTWRTRVEDADGSRLVVVAPTGAPGEALPFEPGGNVVVSWPTELGLVTAEGVLVTTETDVVDGWVVEVERSTRQQRRDAFRLPIELSAVLRPAGGPSVPTDAVTEDVSEVGIACLVPAASAPQVGVVVEVTVAVPDGDPVVADARIVRRTPVESADHEDGAAEDALVRLALELLDPDPEPRERLRRFVLDEQLRRRHEAQRPARADAERTLGAPGDA